MILGKDFIQSFLGGSKMFLLKGIFIHRSVIVIQRSVRSLSISFDIDHMGQYHHN